MFLFAWNIIQMFFLISSLFPQEYFVNTLMIRKIDHQKVAVNHSKDTRIIGGVPASHTDFPWVVYIRRIGGKGITCTGELVNKHWIVTAAHCLLNDDDTGYRDALPLGNTQVFVPR